MKPNELNDMLAILARTPGTLAALLEGLPENLINATEGAETWSPYDVIGHLIHAERTDWLTRTRHIVAGEMRPFEPFDRNAQFSASQSRNIGELLATFAELRRENLAELATMNLTSEDLGRKGVHPDFGEVALGQLLATWAVHDLDHVGQIARTIAKVYTEAVGPWHEYLSILRDRTRGPAATADSDSS